MTKAKKHYYALIDTTTSPKNPGWGFCNSKNVIVFNTQKERAEFLEDRAWWDCSSKAVTLKTAIGYRSISINGYWCAYDTEGNEIEFGPQPEYPKN